MELEDFICVLQIEPHDTFMAGELAKRLQVEGRNEEALPVRRAIVRMDNRFETLHALAQLEYQMGREDEALMHWQQALLVAPERPPELFEVFKNLGNIFVRRGDFETAEDYYFKAHRIQADSDILNVNLGTLAIQRQNWEEAAEKFRQALELNPTNDKAWVGLGICHRMKGDLELSWENMKAALQHNPLNEAALQLMIDWAMSEGRDGLVLEYLRNFLVSGGWNEKMSLAFAWFSYRRGDKRLASFELERVLALNPVNAGALNLRQEMRGWS